MRDNHDGMIEFLDAFEKEGHYFAKIELKSRKYQFGISKAGYVTLKKAMQLRPFDLMPGLKYRYFYAGSNKGSNGNDFTMQVRVELERDATKVELKIPKELHSSLFWFQRLEDLTQANYLEIK